jgi:transposase
MVCHHKFGLGHYRFKCFLKWIAYKRGKHVIDVNEAYTSKTDSRSGEIVEVGPSPTINRMCRDLNGARGILLRTLVT